MIWALEFIAPLLVFVALFDFRARARRRALRPVQVQSEVHDAADQALPREAPEPTPQTEPVIGDTKLAFDELRRAMDNDGPELFAPLLVALTNLVRVGRSLEVQAHLLMQFF